MYLKNDKNVEVTLNQLLSGQIPKDEYKVVVDNGRKVEQIDTTSSSKRAANSDLVKYYTLGEFEGSVQRMNKSKKYYEDHMKAIQAQKEQEEDETKEDRKKLLYLAGIMQYEDDFDDQNLYGANRNKRRGN